MLWQLYEGDELIEIDGHNVHRRSVPAISGLLLGEEGSTVKLTVFRPSSGELKRITIQRSKVGTAKANLRDKLNNNVARETATVEIPADAMFTELHAEVMMATETGSQQYLQIMKLITGNVSERYKIVNSRDADRCTPVFYACGNEMVLQLLLQNGAEINVKNALGNTPLHYAAAADADEAINILVTYGANINAENALGMSESLLSDPVKCAVSFADFLFDSTSRSCQDSTEAEGFGQAGQVGAHCVGIEGPRY